MGERRIGPGFWEIDGFRVEQRGGRWGVYVSPNTDPVFEHRLLKWCRIFIADGLAHDALRSYREVVLGRRARSGLSGEPGLSPDASQRVARIEPDGTDGS